jgi:hypothetical protein
MYRKNLILVLMIGSLLIISGYGLYRSYSTPQGAVCHENDCVLLIPVEGDK